MLKPSNKDHPEKLFFNIFFALSSNLFTVKTSWIDKTNKKNNMGENGSIKISFFDPNSQYLAKLSVSKLFLKE